MAGPRPLTPQTLGSIPSSRIQVVPTNPASLMGLAGFSISAILFTVLTVVWPSAVATKAEVWRVLDLSGLTNSVRQSRNFVRAGYVWLNNEPIRTLRDQMELGRPYRLELRFPNGVIQGRNIFLRRPVLYKPRINQPDTRYHKP